MTSSTSSELTVRNVEPADIGYVECLMKDGISSETKNKYVNRAFFITVSRRAKLDIVSKFVLTVHRYSNLNMANVLSMTVLLY